MEITDQRIYNSNLIKGPGLIQETLVLLEAYNPEENSLAFQKRVVSTGILSKSTDNRVVDIVRNVFTDRFLGYKIDVPVFIKGMRDNHVSIDVITQLFFLYACRANPILGDFVREVFFPLTLKSFAKLQSSDPKNFIKDALSDGRIPISWSESTINKVSRNIMTSLKDFHLIEKDKTILPYRIIDLSANYLVHELHFRGFSDNDIWKHKDWELFGLDPGEVIKTIERISFYGSFIFQFSGEILKLSWKNSSIEEFISNECRQ
ncbi:MAG: DUF1819 family protein [Saprospiraceae bacterium]